MCMWRMVDAILTFNKSFQSPQKEEIISLDWNTCFLTLLLSVSLLAHEKIPSGIYMRLWMDRCCGERIKSKARTYFSKFSSEYRLSNFLNSECWYTHHRSVDTHIHIIPKQLTTLEINYDGSKSSAQSKEPSFDFNLPYNFAVSYTIYEYADHIQLNIIRMEDNEGRIS